MTRGPQLNYSEQCPNVLRFNFLRNVTRRAAPRYVQTQIRLTACSERCYCPHSLRRSPGGETRRGVKLTSDEVKKTCIRASTPPYEFKHKNTLAFYPLVKDDWMVNK
jgi:hypothetical protein